MRRIPLAEQASELERIYRARAGVYVGPVLPQERDRARRHQRRQDVLLAAWQSLAWLAAHPNVLRGYLEFCGPFVRHGEGWTAPPEFK